MKTFLSIFFLVIMNGACVTEYKSMDGYSPSPLEDPVFEEAQVLVELTAFNNWLNENYSNLDEQAKPGLREHLYSLISSYVSSLYVREGIIFPNEHDLALETMLSWGERLGVYGANLFYNKVKRPDTDVAPELKKVPENITISAANDMYLIESNIGSWSLKIPYYFMIGVVNEFTASNGAETQLLSISTGTAKDKTKTGHSQSTLMFIHSPTAGHKDFKEYWLGQFDIGANTIPRPLELNDLESFYTYNKETLLHKEAVFLPASEGSYLVAFLGMDGTFQTNKPHFMDLLSQLKIKS